MRLSEWVKKKGVGEMMRLATVSGIRYGTIHELSQEHTTRAARGVTAMRISKATGGAVTIEDLCVPARVPRKGQSTSTRARRRRARAQTRAAAHG
jgi:DNA-binding transcriptional regulator YdaS (Cro superfamily)